MTSEAYHEDRLSEPTRDMHRAITSLMEELEAVDWYNQRIDATDDEDLKQILIHNRDEEKEHAAMVLEWIRRRDPKFDAQLREWLFSTRSLAQAAAAEAAGDVGEAEGGAPGDVDDGVPHTPVQRLSIGSLRERG